MSTQAKRKQNSLKTQSSLRLVRRKSRSLIRRATARRKAPVAIAIAILVASVVFGVLLEQVVLAQSAFKLTSIRSELAEAETLHQELLLEAARLESPGRIEHVARTQLSMIESPTVEYIVADVGPERERRRIENASLAEIMPADGETTAAGYSGEAP